VNRKPPNIVFAVCKGVTLHERKGRAGTHFLRFLLAPIHCAYGSINMAAPMYETVGIPQGHEVLRRIIRVAGDPAVHALEPWSGHTPEDLQAFTESALLNRCVWISHREPTEEERYHEVTLISAEEAGAALRGGVL
jgi:hypothetical protein